MIVRFLAFLVLLLLPVVAGCYPAKDSIPQASSLRVVEVVELETEDVADGVTLIGELEPWRETTLYFEETGVVDEVFVESGDVVEEGQAIAALVPTDFQLAVSQATAQRDAAQARLDLLLAGTRQEDLDVAKADYQRASVRAAFWAGELTRVKDLFQKKAIPATELEQVQREHDASQQDLLATKARLDRAIAGPRNEEIEAAQADVQALVQAVALAERRLEKATVTAPFGGRLEKRLVDEGAYINVFPTGGVPVGHLVDLDQVDALIAVPESLREQVDKVAHIEVASAVNPDVRADGKLVSLSKVANPASGTYELRIRIPNAQGRFTAGMVVTATVTRKALRQTIRIPVGVVLRAYGQPPYVFLVASSDRVVAQQVELGAIRGDRVEVTSGLSAGDLLVVRGQHQIVPGDRVRHRRTGNSTDSNSEEAP